MYHLIEARYLHNLLSFGIVLISSCDSVDVAICQQRGDISQVLFEPRRIGVSLESVLGHDHKGVAEGV